MKVFGINMSPKATDILNQKLNRISLFNKANEILFEAFGINHFFSNQEEYERFKSAITNPDDIVSDTERLDYGDFQTNIEFAKTVTSFLKEKKGLNPQIVIEPTCGKGNFIIAALSTFKQIEKIIGIEIFMPYIWETKFSIIDFYISHPQEKKPIIELHHFNVFNFKFGRISDKLNKEILILGNPPWVTNSKLSSLESTNLPKKSNFKKHNGLDAITGKGNFDIGEYITLMMFDSFQNSAGHLALLVKNTVIKNILVDQYRIKYKISDIEKLRIDSKKIFNVNVEASLLICKLNSKPEYICNEYNFKDQEKLLREFGWVKNKFVSDINLYHQYQDIDGVCKFEWRQGIKHDLSEIMELDKINRLYVNKKDEEVKLEENMIYGILKSSDLKQIVINKPRKYTIVTQKKVGMDTSYIEQEYQKTFKYLESHKEKFEKRKSSIYKNMPNFSIFGVGDYSFKPYKVAISGLYKTFSFSLILPFNEKPLLLDDTCYFLGFDEIEYAVYTFLLLNSDKTNQFLRAITFPDAKRTFTKEILMRIDLFKLTKSISLSELQNNLENLNNNYNISISLGKWGNYLRKLNPPISFEQMDIFTLAT